MFEIRKQNNVCFTLGRFADIIKNKEKDFTPQPCTAKTKESTFWQ